MGRPHKPDGYRAALTLRMTDELAATVREVAASKGLSASEYIRLIVERDVARELSDPEWLHKRDAVRRRQIAVVETQLEALKNQS